MFLALILASLVAALTPAPIDGPRDSGFRLELRTATVSGRDSIEVRIRNEGHKALLVNKRFAYAGLGNPIAELTFEGKPGPSLGCRFNVRMATPPDYVLLGQGEFVGRTFDLGLLDCFVEPASSVTLRAHYLDKSKPGRSGAVLTEELVSNEIAIVGAASTRWGASGRQAPESRGIETRSGPSAGGSAKR
jgi:hypothetical protein